MFQVIPFEVGEFCQNVKNKVFLLTILDGVGRCNHFNAERNIKTSNNTNIWKTLGKNTSVLSIVFLFSSLSVNQGSDKQHGG